MLMDEKMDHKPIVANSKFDHSPFPMGWVAPPLFKGGGEIPNKSQILNPKITYEELHNKLAELGAKLLIETIPKWTRGEIKPRPQNHSKATYTKIIKKEDGKINWKKPAEETEGQIRALNSWPGTYTIYNGKILKILKGEVSKGNLIIKEVQLEGKKPMSFEDFLRGHPDYIIPQRP